MGQNRGRGGAILTPNKLVLPFGGTYVLPILVKIDQECDRESARRRTDRQTDTLTDANRFYNLSHAICYSYGTDNYGIVTAVCQFLEPDSFTSFGDF